MILFLVRNKHNTPGIIKYPFWQMTYQNPQAVYACVNFGEAYAPKKIAKQFIIWNAACFQKIYDFENNLLHML